MEYIAQICTGGWTQQNYTAEEIIARLEKITEMIPLKSVIIGWNTDRSLYEKTGKWLHEHGVDMLLWLPVFSETADLKEADEAVDLWNQSSGRVELSKGENFSFCCPSSGRNIQNTIDIYEEYFSGCGFDGVFLDKIRTQSFAGGVSGVLSCGCELCQIEAMKRGFSLERFRLAYEKKKDRLFDVHGYDPDKGYVFANPMMSAFLQTKSRIVADAVNGLCRYFRQKGLIVGLDLYAPLFSPFVGQDYELLACEADFIKPMMYRKTDAPAGIGYEYNVLKNALPEAEGYEMPDMDRKFLTDQLNTFRNLPIKKYPGIEINYREDIARTDPEYIRESMQTLRECGMDGAVLAWDVMLAPDSHLEAALISD